MKVWRDKKPDPLDDGLVKLDDYLDGLGLETGMLVLLDRRTMAAPLAECISVSEMRSPADRAVTVLRA